MYPRLVAFVCLAAFSCGPVEGLLSGDDEEKTDKVPQSQLACRFEVRSVSCEDPNGSEWVPDCLDVKTKEGCAEATRPMTQVVAGCEFKLEYQAVEALAGQCANEQLPDVETKGNGEPCSSHQGCVSGLCQPQYYCTVGCKAHADCATEFSNGCCVGEGSLGYCVKQNDCENLCPDGATPQGLPTRCTCSSGFRLSTDGSQCVKEAM
jgi:hypothetical protein